MHKIRPGDIFVQKILKHYALLLLRVTENSNQMSVSESFQEVDD